MGKIRILLNIVTVDKLVLFIDALPTRITEHVSTLDVSAWRTCSGTTKQFAFDAGSKSTSKRNCNTFASRHGSGRARAVSSDHAGWCPRDGALIRVMKVDQRSESGCSLTLNCENSSGGYCHNLEFFKRETMSVTQLSQEKQ